MNLPYQINIHWSDDDEAYIATVPALRGCLAFGDTPEEAAAEVRIAAELWLETAKAGGRPVPRPDAALARLAALAPILKMSRLAKEAGMSAQTLASKIKRGTPLSEKERESVSRVLASHGLA